MDIRPELDPASELPLYKQLGSYLQRLIELGDLLPGDRLPPTRELAGQLGLNRTTVSAAYEILETGGLIKGSVGRGSFVCGVPERETGSLNWSRTLTSSQTTSPGSARPGVINFSASRPSEKLFPVDEFRACCDEVLRSDKLRSLLQLGSPGGYEPLRSFLLHRSGLARATDDILITNGCQQAVDLLRRALVRPGTRVAIEEPVYPGLRNLFLEAGAELIGVPVTPEGMDLYSLRQALEAGAKVVVLTPSFQNPTGAMIPAASAQDDRRHGARGRRSVDRKRYLQRTRLSGRGRAPAEVARSGRHSAGQLFEDRVSRSALRLDHRAEARHRPRHRTEATGGSAHGPAFAGVPAAFCGIGPARSASGQDDCRGQREAARRGAGVRQISARTAGLPCRTAG